MARPWPTCCHSFLRTAASSARITTSMTQSDTIGSKPSWLRSCANTTDLCTGWRFRRARDPRFCGPINCAASMAAARASRPTCSRALSNSADLNGAVAVEEPHRVPVSHRGRKADRKNHAQYGKSAAAPLYRNPRRPDVARQRIGDERGEQDDRRLHAHQHKEQRDEEDDDERDAAAQVDRLEGVVLEGADHGEACEDGHRPRPPAHSLWTERVAAPDPPEPGDQRRREGAAQS